jgi:spore coat protein U-like protein
MRYRKPAGQKGENEVKRFLLYCLPVLALFLLLAAAPAFAASASANITVQATVAANCTINAGTVNLGTYDPTGTQATNPLDGEGNFVIRCTRGTAATIDLGLGNQPSGTTRRMTDGTDFLDYDLYRDSGRSAVWGTGAGNNLNPFQADAGGVAPNSGNRTITVYGRVPAGQANARSGVYGDTVLATINF